MTAFAAVNGFGKNSPCIELKFVLFPGHILTILDHFLVDLACLETFPFEKLPLGSAS